MSTSAVAIQPAQRFSAALALEIQRDAFLAAVQGQEEAAPAVDERTPAARIVAVLRFFDLENLGAHVAEHHRAVRPGNDPA
jgi:hypothetical protein